MSVNYAIYLAIRIIFSQSHFNLLTLKISKSIKICQTGHYFGNYRRDHFFLTEMSKYRPHLVESDDVVAVIGFLSQFDGF